MKCSLKSCTIYKGYKVFVMQKRFVVLILLLSGMLGFLLSWHLHPDVKSDPNHQANFDSTAQIALSSDPNHQPNLDSTAQIALPEDTQQIKTSHKPASFVKQLKGDPDAGRKIFIEFCSACHAAQPRIDINAPHVGDANVWKGLKSLGMPMLLQLTEKGVNAMPARGGCFECSDTQLQQAIEYMMEQSLD